MEETTLYSKVKKAYLLELMLNYFTFTSSTSNVSHEFPGIVPGTPLVPYLQQPKYTDVIELKHLR